MFRRCVFGPIGFLVYTSIGINTYQTLQIGNHVLQLASHSYDRNDEFSRLNALHPNRDYLD